MEIEEIQPRKETNLPNSITVTSTNYIITIDDKLTSVDQTSVSFAELEYTLGTYNDHELIVALIKEYFQPTNFLAHIKSLLPYYTGDYFADTI